MRRRILPAACAVLFAAAWNSEALAHGWHHHHHHQPTIITPPQAPPPTYGFPGPTFRWGWFGVNYRPRMVHHTGYYNDFWQWGYRHGY